MRAGGPWQNKLMPLLPWVPPPPPRQIPPAVVRPVENRLELGPMPVGFESVDESDGSLTYLGDSPVLRDLLLARVRVLGLRHGEAVSNAQSEALGQPLLYGQSESPLTDRGRQQAAGCADLLVTELGGQDWLQSALLDPQQLPILLCSDVSRARETADIMKACLAQRAQDLGGLPGRAVVDAQLLVCGDVRLRETHFGRFERRPFAELKHAYPDFVAHWRPNHGQGTDFRHRFPGGESRADVMCRMGDFLQSCCQRFPGRTVVLISHGETLLSTRALLGKSPLQSGKVTAETGLFPNATPFWLVGGEKSLPSSQLIWSEACRNRL